MLKYIQVYDMSSADLENNITEVTSLVVNYTYNRQITTTFDLATVIDTIETIIEKQVYICSWPWLVYLKLKYYRTLHNFLTHKMKLLTKIVITKLKLKGYVSNLPFGSNIVEIQVEICNSPDNTYYNVREDALQIEFIWLCSGRQKLSVNYKMNLVESSSV